MNSNTIDLSRFLGTERPVMPKRYVEEERDHLAGFRFALASHDLHPDDIVPDGEIHRFSTGSRRSNQNGYYSLTQTDWGYHGCYGDWARDVEPITWSSYREADLSTDQQAELRRHLAEQRAAFEEESRRRAEMGKVQAKADLDQMLLADPHFPYFRRKGITPTDGIRMAPDGSMIAIPMYDITGTIQSYQRIYKDGVKKFMGGGSSKNAFYLILGETSHICICEGYATAVTVSQALGYLTVCAFNAGNLKGVAAQFKQHYPDAKIMICADNDHEKAVNVGLKAAQAAAKATGAIVIFPPAEKGISDFNDLSCLHGIHAVKRRIEVEIEAAEAPDCWPQPVDLAQKELPPMDTSKLPDVLAAMVNGVVAETETPAELGILYGIGTISAACQGRYIVELEPGYTEPTNTYTCTFLDPGNRKSAVQRKFAAPLIEYEATAGLKLEAEIQAATSKRKSQEARIKILRDKYAKAEPKALEGIEKEVADIEQNMVEIPIKPQVWTQDVTPERAGSLMAENGGKIAILSAEGGIFENIGGRYSNGIPNLDVFLQGHSGDPIRVDRGSRSLQMQSPALTMALSAQPGILSALSRHAAFRSYGLWARFLMAMPASPLGHRTLQTVPLDPAVKRRFHDCILALLETETEKDEFGRSRPHILHLSAEAHRKWKSFAHWVERGLADGGEFEHLRDWAGKLSGQAARLAALFHCAENAHNEPRTKPISEATMVQALHLATVLSRHAMVIFDMIGASKELTDARKIWQWVDRTKQSTFKRQECYQALRGTFPKVADLVPGLNMLIDRHYIRERQLNVTGPGRPSVQYEVNPSLVVSWS